MWTRTLQVVVDTKGVRGRTHPEVSNQRHPNRTAAGSPATQPSSGPFWLQPWEIQNILHEQICRAGPQQGRHRTRQLGLCLPESRPISWDCHVGKGNGGWGHRDCWLERCLRIHTPELAWLEPQGADVDSVLECSAEAGGPPGPQLEKDKQVDVVTQRPRQHHSQKPWRSVCPPFLRDVKCVPNKPLGPAPAFSGPQGGRSLASV